ncbi:MAG: hypothetical protein ACHQII_00215 [Bacteroidia bacterium]
MAKKKKKSKPKAGLHGMAVPAGFNAKIKESAIETLKDVAIGVIGGGLTGLVLGKSSLLIGAGVTGYGHFENKPFFKTFGMGMMMGGSASAAGAGLSAVSADDIKARIVSFKDDIISKLYLDKVFKKDETKAPAAKKTLEGAEEDIVNMNGFGENEPDFSSLNKLEQQVLQSGHDYQKKKEEDKPAENLSSSYAELLDTKNSNY